MVRRLGFSRDYRPINAAVAPRIDERELAILTPSFSPSAPTREESYGSSGWIRENEISESRATVPRISIPQITRCLGADYLSVSLRGRNDLSSSLRLFALAIGKLRA
jgi:hypothetical protein